MNSKRKGSAGERELLEILQQHGDAIRNDQTFKGGAGNPDISFLTGGNKYHVEVKRVERLNIHAAIQQAERDATPENIPIVVHRRNREQWYLTIGLTNFFKAMNGGKHDRKRV